MVRKQKNDPIHFILLNAAIEYPTKKDPYMTLPNDPFVPIYFFLHQQIP